MAGQGKGWPGSPKTLSGANLVLGGSSKYRLTKAQVRMLTQLCHPDKHDNSELAKKAFEFLRNYDAAD